MTMRPPFVALLCAICTAVSAADFIVGADVSTLTEVERHGGKFSDAEGRPGDPLHILRDHGMNWVRLRLWHTPVNAADVVEAGRVVSRRGEPVGGGNNDLALTLALAKRARAEGLKVLLDIHYSDFWADPGTQTKPAAWTHLHGRALQRAVRSYTADVLRAFLEAGAPPDMVQIGNETNGGMLWPDGKTWQQTPGEKSAANVPSPRCCAPASPRCANTTASPALACPSSSTSPVLMTTRCSAASSIWRAASGWTTTSSASATTPTTTGRWPRCRPTWPTWRGDTASRC